jgi:hypothetical protein
LVCSVRKWDMSLRIKALIPKEGQRIDLGQLNVLVGPNNSGKSRTLTDIKNFITSGRNPESPIISWIDIDLPTQHNEPEGAQRRLNSHPPNIIYDGLDASLLKMHTVSLPTENWLQEHYVNCSGIDSLQASSSKELLLSHLGQFWIAHLHAEGRFQLAASTEAYNRRTQRPFKPLHILFEKRLALFEQLRDAFQEAFKRDIAFDWGAMTHFCLKVDDDFGHIPDTWQDVYSQLHDVPELDQQGDGYKSFTSIVLAMLTSPHRVLLLDEPEAFLHPAQAKVLGRWIANHAESRAGQVLVATHSADFLEGVVSANTDASIIRLNRNFEIHYTIRTVKQTTYHLIPPEAVKKLAQTPLLSSQPVLDALFRKGVVVCEGDPDRVIYQKVAQLLGENEILFIHSNGKQAAYKPVELFTQACTPVCTILDFDCLNSKSSTALTDTILALTGKAPDESILKLQAKVCEFIEKIPDEQLLNTLKQAIHNWQEEDYTDFLSAKKALEKGIPKSNWEHVKKKGIEIFTGETLQEVNELILKLNNIGLFLVPTGELESWIPLGSTKGKKWNLAALEALHNDKCPEKLKTFIQEVITFLDTRLVGSF